MPETTTHLNFVPVDFNPFESLEVESIAPSTESQREIWASCILGGDNASRGFNESLTLHLSGPLNKNALQISFQKLIDRNDSLRSVFSSDGKQIHVYKQRQIDIYYQDISSKPDFNKREIIEEYINLDLDNIFSLHSGPLLKAGLFKINDTEHEFILTTHHIICDGWSLGIFLQDLGKLYSAYAQNTPLELPKAPRFNEYANDLQKFMDSEDYHNIEQFWIDKFQGDVPLLNLPTDFKRPALRTYASNRLDYAVDKNLIAGLKKAGLQNGCSLVITLMAAFEVFLCKLTRQNDIVLGLPAADQLASGNYQLIGHCVNLLPVRSKLIAEESFAQFLKRHKNSMLDAYEHQQITYGTLVKKLKIQRDPSRVPLVPVVFNIDIGLTDGFGFHGLDFKLTSNPRHFENFDIFLNASGSENSFVLEWSYNTSLFKPESIGSMMAGFENVLKTLVNNPDVLLSEFFSDDSKVDIEKLNSRNNTAVEYQNTKLLKDLIDETALKFPDKVALAYLDQEISFKELNEKSNQLARYIIKNNIRIGDTIGLALERSPEMLISLLGILKTGATFVPIDPGLPKDRISFMLADSSARMLITSKKYKDNFTSDAKEILIEDALVEADKLPNTDPDMVISGNDIAYIIYTSGSTGQPKGVLIEQYSILNYIQNSINAYSTDDQQNSGTFFHLSLSFDASLTALFVPLITGKTIVISSEISIEVFNDNNLVKYAPFDFIKLTPAQLYLLNNSRNASAKFATKKFVIGGEALFKRHIEFFRQNNVDAEIINEYGPTETTVGCIYYKFNTLDDIQETANGILIGKPMPNVKVYILDEHFNRVPDGIEGEIFIGGVQVGKGYLNRPELTNEKFINDPFSNNKEDRVYKTGDLGKYTPNGDIEYVGRIDKQVKIRGYRIEPGEIESLLLKQESVKHALVIANEDETGDKRLIAYIVTSNNISSEEYTEKVKEWKNALKNALPAYMIPSDFISIPKIPLTINGKVDTDNLPKPKYQVNDSFDSSNSPSTPIETLIANIWSDILKIENIGIHDNFFELGGYSLIAIESMIRLEKQTGTKLPMSALLEYPTIHQLGTFLYNGININKWKSLVPIKPSGTKTPLYIVHGAGLGVIIFNHLSAHLDEEQPIYGLQGLGIDSNDEPLETVEETAAFYISEMLQQNPDGPYILAGFSDGGIIAFEIAQQLKAMNKEVKMLGIFDTEVENYFQNNSSKNRFKRMMIRLVPRLYHEARCLVKHPKKALIYQKQCIQMRFISMAKRIGFENKPVLEDTLVFIHKAMEKYESSLTSYTMKTYDGTIDLFRSKIRVNYVNDFKFLGWKSFIKKEIKIHEVPGDHDDMLLPPNCVEFAHILQQAINNS